MVHSSLCLILQVGGTPDLFATPFEDKHNEMLLLLLICCCKNTRGAKPPRRKMMHAAVCLRCMFYHYQIQQQRQRFTRLPESALIMRSSLSTRALLYIMALQVPCRHLLR